MNSTSVLPRIWISWATADGQSYQNIKIEHRDETKMNSRTAAQEHCGEFILKRNLLLLLCVKRIIPRLSFIQILCTPIATISVSRFNSSTVLDLTVVERSTTIIQNTYCTVTINCAPATLSHLRFYYLFYRSPFTSTTCLFKLGELIVMMPLSTN